MLHFCRSGDHNFQTLFTFKPFIAAHGRLTAASPNAKRSGSALELVAGPSASQTCPTSQFRRPTLSRSSSLYLKLVQIQKIKKFQIFSLYTCTCVKINQKDYIHVHVHVYMYVYMYLYNLFSSILSDQIKTFSSMNSTLLIKLLACIGATEAT